MYLIKQIALQLVGFNQMSFYSSINVSHIEISPGKVIRKFINFHFGWKAINDDFLGGKVFNNFF